ncbi:MAG: hypothetical protein M3T56_09390 [Chloroflexota bacterium]|nr:hypothetical protein [Chloroflexota bacterium]
MDAGLIAALLRSLVAWVFLTAGVDKALHINSFTAALEKRYGLRRSVAGLLGPVVCLVEIFLGGALLLGIVSVELALASAVLLIGLSVVAAWRRPHDAPETCACGGLADSGEGPAHLAINGGLIGAALVSAALSSSSPPQTDLFEHLGPELVSVGGLALVLLLGVRSAVALTSISRTWHEIDERRMT